MNRSKVKNPKYRVPPAFSSDNARKAQALSIVARRAMDERLRRELAEWLPAMSRQLRRRTVNALRIRQVEALRAAALKERAK